MDAVPLRLPPWSSPTARELLERCSNAAMLGAPWSEVCHAKFAKVGRRHVAKASRHYPSSSHHDGEVCDNAACEVALSAALSIAAHPAESPAWRYTAAGCWVAAHRTVGHGHHSCNARRPCRWATPHAARARACRAAVLLSAQLIVLLMFVLFATLQDKGDAAVLNMNWLNMCAARPTQVVFVTTEVAPWSKSGGLADVLSGLPAALAARRVLRRLASLRTLSQLTAHRGRLPAHTHCCPCQCVRAQRTPRDDREPAVCRLPGCRRLWLPSACRSWGAEAQSGHTICVAGGRRQGIRGC